jgi:hypothetical protein
MVTEIPIVNPEEFLDSIIGRSVTGGEVNTDGLHLFLSDGRALIILGIVCVCDLEKETLQ